MLPPVPPTLWFLLLVGISMSNIFTFAKISQKCEQSGLIALFLFTSPLLAWCFAKMHGQVWKAWFNQFTCQKVLWSCLQSKYHSGASLNHFVEMKNLQEFTVSIFRLGKKFYTVLMKYSLTIIVCSLSLNMVLFTFFDLLEASPACSHFFLKQLSLFRYFLVSLKLFLIFLWYSSWLEFCILVVGVVCCSIDPDKLSYSGTIHFSAPRWLDFIDLETIRDK